MQGFHNLGNFVKIVISWGGGSILIAYITQLSLYGNLVPYEDSLIRANTLRKHSLGLR